MRRIRLGRREKAVPLQNRVDPFGRIHAVAERGMFTGNRGVIHDPETKTLLKRGWTTPAWLICECRYKGFRRDPMGRNARSGGAGWTELFFLDEVTGLAAGHRPCFLCRREPAKAFARCWSGALAMQGVSAPEIDARLHGERLASGGREVALDAGGLRKLPDGAMFAAGPTAFAIKGRKALPWSFGGYGAAMDIQRLPASEFHLLTPPTTVAALAAGFRPIFHETANC
jgi:hypothetical protein